MNDLRTIIRYLCQSAERGYDSEAAIWVWYYFVRNNGWQLVLAGLVAALAAHLLLYMVWLLRERRRPQIKWYYMLTKLVSSLFVPYFTNVVMSGLQFLREPRPWNGAHYELIIMAAYLLVRVSVLSWTRRNDLVPYEIVCAVFESFLVMPISAWIIANIFNSLSLA